MGLTRTLRKHMKKLMAIFGALLMVAFLLPTSLRQIAKRGHSDGVIAEIYNGRQISQRDLAVIRNQAQILDNLAGYLGQQPGGQMLNWRIFISPLSEYPLLDYLLLIEEAQQMGIEVPDQQVDWRLQQWQVPSQLINNIMKHNNVSVKMVRKVVGNLISVHEAFALASTAVTSSEPQLRHFFATIRNRINVRILPLTDEAFLRTVPQPDTAQLADYFMANRENYRYPDRVIVEYIRADLDKIASTMKISRRSAHNYWQDHRSQFTTTAPASLPTTTAAATSEPVTRQLSFEEARQAIEATMAMTRARRRATEALSIGRRTSLSQWSKLQDSDNATPAAFCDYRKLAEQLSEEQDIDLDYHRSGLIDKLDAGKLQGIGRSFIQEENSPLTFAEYAFRSLVEEPDNISRDQTLRLAVGQDCGGLLRSVGYDGQVDGFYIFRVIEVFPSNLPQSLDEVQEAVVDDWQLHQAYKLACDAANTMLPLAQQADLNSLLAGDHPAVAKLKQQVDQLPEVTAEG